MPPPSQNGKNNQEFKLLRLLAQIILILGMIAIGIVGLIVTACGVLLGGFGNNAGEVWQTFVPILIGLSIVFIVFVLIFRALK